MYREEDTAFVITFGSNKKEKEKKEKDGFASRFKGLFKRDKKKEKKIYNDSITIGDLGLCCDYKGKSGKINFTCKFDEPLEIDCNNTSFKNDFGKIKGVSERENGVCELGGFKTKVKVKGDFSEKDFKKGLRRTVADFKE